MCSSHWYVFSSMCEKGRIKQLPLFYRNWELWPPLELYGQKRDNGLKVSLEDWTGKSNREQQQKKRHTIKKEKKKHNNYEQWSWVSSLLEVTTGKVTVLTFCWDFRSFSSVLLYLGHFMVLTKCDLGSSRKGYEKKLHGISKPLSCLL